MIMNDRYRKWLPVIAGITTGIVTALFLSGYLYPIEKGTPQGGITGAIGVGIIAFISFGIGVFLRFYQKNKNIKIK